MANQIDDSLSQTPHIHGKYFWVRAAIFLPFLFAAYFFYSTDGIKAELRDVGNAVHRTYEGDTFGYAKGDKFDQTYVIFSVQTNAEFTRDGAVFYMPVKTAKTILPLHSDRFNGDMNDHVKNNMSELNMLYDVSVPGIPSVLQNVKKIVDASRGRLCARVQGMSLGKPHTLSGHEVQVISTEINKPDYVYLSDIKIVSCS